jgi:hypothetical protein
MNYFACFLWALGVLSIGLNQKADAQLFVSLPDTVISDEGDNFAIEIPISGVGQDSVSGFTFSIQYNPSKITINGYEKTALSSSFFVQDNNQKAGIYRITAAGSQPFFENGIIIQLNTTVLDTGSTHLRFTQASVNEGDPELISENGKLTIWNYEYSPKLLFPNNRSLDVDTNATLTWEPNPLYTQYEVHLSEEQNFNPSFVFTDISDTTLTVASLDFNTEYYWRVRAVSDQQTSSFSSTFSFLTRNEPNTPPTVNSSMKDVLLNEDFIEYRVAFLDTVFKDLETTELEYTIHEPIDVVVAEIKNRTLILKSIHNLYGTDTLIVKATDEEGLHIMDSLLVEINPINDPPEIINAFPEKIDVSTTDSIRFSISEYIIDVDSELSTLRPNIIQLPEGISFEYDTVNSNIELSFFAFTGTDNILFEIVDDSAASTGEVEIIIEKVSIPIDEQGELITEFRLSQNYPNPFNPTTNINFSIPQSGPVTLKVFDISGREIVTLVDGVQTTGQHSVNFDAANLASGIYIYQLTAGSKVETRSMLLIK